MANKNQKNLSQKAGISLITVFFVMTIIMSVVLSISLLIFSELKNAHNAQNSIASFYLADSGVEKFLYFNRKHIPATPPGITNGFCNICNVCSDCECPNQPTGDDCLFCKSCEVSYATVVGDTRYDTIARIVPNGNFFNLDISVKGLYEDTSRAIGLKIVNKDLSSSAPTISSFSAIRDPENFVIVTISANVTDPEGVDETTVVAHIKNPDDSDFATVPLERQGGNTYVKEYFVPEGAYYVYIWACDMFRNCGGSARFSIN